MTFGLLQLFQNSFTSLQSSLTHLYYSRINSSKSHQKVSDLCEGKNRVGGGKTGLGNSK